MAISGEAKRIALWSFWIANLLVNVVFVVCCWTTADNLSRAGFSLHIENGWKDVGQQTVRAFLSNNIWRAPVAACAIGGLLVTLFNLVSCLVLMRRSYLRAAPGFGYGFVLAWAFVLSFLTLLIGIVLQGFDKVVATQLEGAGAENWTPLATGTFRAAYGLSYVCAALYAVFSLALLALQRQVGEGLGIHDALRAHDRAAEASAVAAGGRGMGMGADALGASGPI